MRKISETQRVSAATGIIYGLALGYLSCIAPTIALAVTIIPTYLYLSTYPPTHLPTCLRKGR